RRRHTTSKRDWSSDVCSSDLNIIMAVWSLFIILPFVLLLMSSITDESVLLTKGYGFIPEKFSLAAYSYIFKSGDKILSAYAHTRSEERRVGEECGGESQSSDV